MPREKTAACGVRHEDAPSSAGNKFGIGIDESGFKAFSQTQDREGDKRHHTTIRMGLARFAVCFIACIFRDPIGEVIKRIPKSKSN